VGCLSYSAIFGRWELAQHSSRINPENQDAKTSKGPIPRSFWISDYKEKQFAGKRKIEDY
jgi:hypothetical protein